MLCGMREPLAHREKNLIMKSHRLLLRIVGLMLMLYAAAWAQDTASITGTVSDSSGAAVPKALVTVKDPEHGVGRSLATDSAGMGAVIGYYTHCERQGARMVVAGVGKRVSALFKVTRVDTVIPMSASAAEADA